MSLAKTAQLSPTKLDSDLLYIMDEDLSVSEEHEEPKGKVVMLVSEDEPEEEINFELPEVPGGTSQDKVELEVEEEPEVEVSAPGKWDWKSLPISKWTSWIKEKMDNPPSHSGQDTVGIERCIAHFQKLNREISQMVRLDIDGVLNVGLIEKAREEVHKAIDRLEERLNRLNSNKFKKKKKADFEGEEGFVKEAQKAAGVYGRISVTVPLLISHIARVCINSVVSAGKDLEDTYDKMVAKYKLTDREQAELQQLIQDMGFPIKNREYNGDSSSEENPDYIAQYFA
jgi:hypothetical protein